MNPTLTRARAEVRCAWTLLALLVCAMPRPAHPYGGGCSSPDLYPTGGSWPRFGAVADFDRANGPDIIVVNSDSDTVAVLLNNGDGSFRAPVTYDIAAAVTWQFDIAAGDFDGVDGPDFVYITDSGHLRLRFNNGDGTFGPEVVLPFPSSGSGPWIEVADIDGTGGPDVIAGHLGVIVVYLNDGSGGFGPPIEHDADEIVSSEVLIEVDGDPELELVTGNTNEWSEDVFIRDNLGGGSFDRPVIAAWWNNLAHDMAAADFDGSLGPDLVLYGSLFSSINVYFNDGSGSFTFNAANDQYWAGRSPHDVQADDLDCLDGPDLLVSDADRNVVSFLRNDGSGHFEPELTFPTDVDPWDILIADYDQSGEPDWAVVNGTGTISVALNCVALTCLDSNWLLRDDSVRSLAPHDPPKSEIFVFEGGLLMEDGHVDGFVSGELDPDATVLDDASRPLVFYQVTEAGAVLQLVKSNRSIRVSW